MCSRRKITIIGIPDSQPPYLCDEAWCAIGSATVFSGGARHRELMMPLLPDGVRWIEIKAPLDAVFEQYEAVDGSIVVFASGDPLFYGFASTVMRRIPDAYVRVYPWFNSLQTLAAAFLLPYQSMVNVTLTGRDWPGFDAALIEGQQMVGVLTDGRHTPDAIARRMLEYGYVDNYELFVGERLGNPGQQRLVSGSVTEIADMRFRQPNCLILRQVRPHARPFGIPDGDFEGLPGRPAMITKRAVRLATLSALGLRDRRCLWDVGFCTGSVSIEARMQFPHLKVVAFERRPECEEIIAGNCRRFGVPGIEVVMGDFAEATLDALPQPDAVFIGGHGGHLADFMTRISALLPPGGVVVFNSVTEASHSDFMTVVEACGLTFDGEETLRVDNHNPITILKATR